MVKIEKNMLDTLSMNTGLRLATCLDLLSSGWTYNDSVDEPARWEAPVLKLVKECDERVK